MTGSALYGVGGALAGWVVVMAGTAYTDGKGISPAALAMIVGGAAGVAAGWKATKDANEALAGERSMGALR